MIPLSDEVILITIEIRKKRKIKMPDAIIAASAIVSDLGLVTRNVADFNNIGLKEILNPWEI